MIAVDTNILVYAHRPDSSWHQPALSRLTELASSGATWAIPWPCVHEFLATVTHPRVFKNPTPTTIALAAMDQFAKLSSLRFIGETEGYYELFASLVQSAAVVGPMVHDARVAALCLHHGVSELWTADRDFGRFPKLRTRNPLVGQ
ncbi:MAG: type II toxin-antitoxin system VapC family toxin [Myxococcaceae bacterium]